jgi:hypothetical protein
MGRLKNAVMEIMEAHEAETGEEISFDEAAEILQERLEARAEAAKDAQADEPGQGEADEP